MSIDSQSFLPLIARMFDAAVTDGKGYEQIIDLLSLFCLITIVTRQQGQLGATPNFAAVNATTQSNTAAGSADNSMQKTLTDLLKNVSSGGNGGGSGPDLMTLLPLLNNPQIKSKMNPTNMAAIMSLLGNMGSGNSDTKKAEQATQPPLAHDAAPPAATSNQAAPFNTSPDESDPKSSHYLNWKTNF